MEVKKRIVEKVKNVDLNIVKNFIIKNKGIIFMSIPFILVYMFFNTITSNINYSFKGSAPIYFGVIWILLFVGIIASIKSKISKPLYIILISIFTVLYFVHSVYYSMMNTIFNFNLLYSTNEGMTYAYSALKNAPLFTFISTIIIIFFVIISIIFYREKKTTSYKSLGIILIVFVVLHTLIPLTFGKANDELTWSSWRNARNIYATFNDSNKSAKISGFYEFTFRDFYLTFLKIQEPESVEDTEFLETAFSYVENSQNNFSGLFKGKNLIIVQLEGMDNWILNKDNTPTLYRMMSEGINFTDHYSFYNGGGSTFNSEFAINTGFVTPYSYNKNAYLFNKNLFPNSLPKTFKNLGYSVNAFHMNSGEYYSRTINYKNWGYEKYYGLKDEGTYSTSSYELDRELMLNEHFNQLMFPENKNFLDYIITYSGHVPFTNKKGVCKMLYEEDNRLEDGTLPEEVVEMSEEECVIRQNKETDYMMELMLEKLEENELLDNTVILVITDHYLYTLEDQTILDKYKETSNNLINKTPFFIWSKGINKYEVKEVTSQLNVLPTILNLFGFSYNKNAFIGEDALDSSYRGIVFFSDYSWYDGNAYVDGGIVMNGAYISEEDLENKNYQVNYLTKKNDLALKYDYFRSNGINKEESESAS